MSSLETKPAVAQKSSQVDKQQKQKARFSVAINTKGYQELIRNTLSDERRANRFIANITSAVAVNPDLQDCDASSILAAGLLGESLGLLPSPQLGQFYLVPFECRVKGPDGKAIVCIDESGNPIKDRNGRTVYLTEKKATFVVGYKGLTQMAMKSGAYADIDATEVMDGEYTGRDKMTGKPTFSFIEDYAEWKKTPVCGYMSFLEMTSGFRKVMYMPKDEIIDYADTYSPAFSKSAYEKILRGEIADKDMWKYSSFWYKDFNAMARKTMLRQLLTKWGILSDSLQDAFVNDGAVIEIDQNKNFIATHPEMLELPEPVSMELPQKVDLDKL